MPELIISNQSHEAMLMDISQLRSALVQCGKLTIRTLASPSLSCRQNWTYLFQGVGLDDMHADESLQLRRTTLILTRPDDSIIFQYKYDLPSSLRDYFDETGFVEHLYSPISTSA